MCTRRQSCFGAFPETRGFRGVRYATAIYIFPLQDTLFICYELSLDNARSVTFSQRANSPLSIEDETLNDGDIINKLIDYVDGQEEPDSLQADKIYTEIQLCNKLGKHFLKTDTNFERRMKFQKEFRSCISGYHDIYKQLTNRPSRQKLIFYLMVPKNKSMEIVSSSDETNFELIHHKKRNVLDYDE
ncbi:uncharacterized protein TNCV_2970251 [Trichonephila clavipes]|nr:uncharacterized protein TNCV_2970251 [Trichonephila clavipes]